MLTKNKLYSRNDVEVIGFEECNEKEVNDLMLKKGLLALTFKGKHYVFMPVGLEMLQFAFDYDGLKQLVNTVINCTQVPFKYFEWNSLLLLNVSFSEDGLQEFAFYKKDDQTEKYYKFESYTISWMTEDRLSSLLVSADHSPIHQIEGLAGGIPLREWNGPGSHIFTFEQFNNFKKEFSEFISTY